MNSTEEPTSHGDPSSSIVNQTIEIMEHSQLCIHPIHKHSFAPVSFLISGSMRKCAGCHERIKSVVLGSYHTGTRASNGTPKNQVVRCMSCYTYAHRSCALNVSPKNNLWKELCPINLALVPNEIDECTDQRSTTSSLDARSSNGREVQPGTLSLEDEVFSQKVEEHDPGDQSLTKDATYFPQEERITLGPYSSEGNSPTSSKDTSSEPGTIKRTPSPRFLFGRLSSSSSSILRRSVDEEGSKKEIDKEKSDVFAIAQSTKKGNFDERSTTKNVKQAGNVEVSAVWTPDGPPRHWASTKSLHGISRRALHTNESSEEEGGEEGPYVATEPLHHARQSFASVSCVLQENILAYFRKVQDGRGEEVVGKDSIKLGGEAMSEHIDEMKSEITEGGALDQQIIVTTRSADISALCADVNGQSLLTEVNPLVPPDPQKPSMVKLATDGLAAIKVSAVSQKKMGVAAVAGGVAGGAAGLLLAGPAGAVIGAKAGQTAGVLGVILEGSVSVGVFVAGVAAASYTAQQLQLKEEQRVLTLGEDGTHRKILLVRPDMVVNPVWEEFTADAIRSSPTNKNTGPFGIIASFEGRQAATAKKQRYRRDSDIVEADEYEIPTQDKVLLLVSRSLNDKCSLPGHVYRYLIQVYRSRCQDREGGNEQRDVSETASIETPLSLRDRRRDAHGVVKHVTATLLEVRPGFASSPVITEMSATAVEGLVFGELYDSVFEEIVEETKILDYALIEKIQSFELDQASNSDVPRTWRNNISQSALDALGMIPEAHSAVDKLRHCVHFLELISEYFSTSKQNGQQMYTMSADSLLKMVCQHTIVAKVPHINAEIAFLEEFVRDEHLLRGKEGYALVTMQASLHFLNGCDNFQIDIVDQEDE